MTASLVTALNAPSARRILPVNPAAGIPFRTSKVRPLLWTDERVARFRQTSERPSPVMVWTERQAGAFLDSVAEDRLYALWHTAVQWGLRRGELVGLRWSDVRLESSRVSVRHSGDGDPKSEAGLRTITVDPETVGALKAWRKAQAEEHLAWGPAWEDSDRVFTRENGGALDGGQVGKRFDLLVTKAGLPPVRFHDLRHGSATMLLAAGVPMKVVSEVLGHASSAFTADVYTSVSEDLADRAAQAIAAFIPRRQRDA